MRTSRLEIAGVVILTIFSTTVTNVVLNRFRSSASSTATARTPAPPPLEQLLGTGGKLAMPASVPTATTSRTVSGEKYATWTVRNVGTTPLKIALSKSCDCTRANLRHGKPYSIAPGKGLAVTAYSKRVPTGVLPEIWS